MAANTTPDNITYPVGTDQVAPLHTVFAVLANSVQTALNSRGMYTYRWANNAARTSQTGMRNGDQGYQVDTDSWYDRVGGVWAIRDTGWTNLSLNAGFTTGTGNDAAAYRVINGICYFKSYVQRTAGNYPSSSTIVGTLPVAARPVRALRVSAASGGSVPTNMVISALASGGLEVFSGGGTTSDIVNLGGLTYPTS